MTSKPKVTLRAADSGDSARVLAWANDPAARAASFSGETIGAAEHERWYQKSLGGARRLFVIENHGEPAGLVRLDPIDAAAFEVGIVVDSAFRGRGIAKLALAALDQQALAAGGESLLARIRVENRPSRRLFASAGYMACGETNVRGIPAVLLRRDLSSGR